MAFVPSFRVEPGQVQPVEAVGPKEWWHRLDESPATLGVGGYFGKSRNEITAEECLVVRCLLGTVPLRGAAAPQEEEA